MPLNWILIIIVTFLVMLTIKTTLPPFFMHETKLPKIKKMSKSLKW